MGGWADKTGWTTGPSAEGQIFADFLAEGHFAPRPEDKKFKNHLKWMSTKY
jgi:hypothetical protein